MCHGELARRRPAPNYLTAFYLWMSAGGMIGGIAAALVAPYVFNWVAEYPILIALAVLCRPGVVLPQHTVLARIALFGAARRRWRVVLIGLSAHADRGRRDALQLDRRRPPARDRAVLARAAAFAAIVGFVLIGNHMMTEQAERPDRAQLLRRRQDHRKFRRRVPRAAARHHHARRRSASATPTASRSSARPSRCSTTTTARPSRRRSTRRTRAPAAPIRIAVIGLGAGTLACRADPDDTLHYYEIDPAIIRIARDPQAVHLPVGVPARRADHARRRAADAGRGARRLLRPHHRRCLLLRRHPDPPAHARGDGDLSEQAHRARHGGAAHLEPAPRARLRGRRHRRRQRAGHARERRRRTTRRSGPYKYAGTVAAVARREEDFGALAQSKDWRPTEPDPRQWVWTDDYSNIVGSLLRKLEE